jgi:pimeloyl-ACP methyl ester carboxylesterase
VKPFLARAPAGFSSRWLAVGGLRLHALESAGGSGPAVVLVPGLVTASRSMIPLARALARYGLRVRILDLPGFGYSDKPRRALSIREQAALVAQWLADIADGPVMLIGNSVGTQIAAAVAAWHPDAVWRLVLVSPTIAPEVRQRLSRLAAVPRPARPGQPSRWRRGRWRVLLLRALHGAMGQGASLRLLNVAEYGCASFPRAAGALRAAAREPIEQALPSVRAPILVIRGDHDHLSSAEWAGELARLARRGRLARLPGAGHDAFYAAADAVADRAAPFLISAGLPARLDGSSGRMKYAGAHDRGNPGRPSW